MHTDDSATNMLSAMMRARDPESGTALTHSEIRDELINMMVRLPVQR